MTIHYTDDRVTLHHGDCLDVLRELPDCSVDSVVTDPPYGLEFMGKDWDAPWKASSVGRGVRVAAERADEMTDEGKGHSTSGGPYLAARVDSVRVAGLPFQQWCQEWATECLRVLKPGGHMLAFGGSRTWHRLAAAVEDAGFEIRDSIAWLYGSGFPKSLDVSKAIDKAAGVTREAIGVAQGAGNGSVVGLGSGRSMASEYDVTTPATAEAEQWEGWGTALKPAFEPIVVGRKPLIGTVAANILAHGTGALNIAATRVGDEERVNPPVGDLTSIGSSRDKPLGEANPVSGRWPTNVVLDESQAAELDKQTGTLKSGANPTRRGSDKFRDAYGDFKGQENAAAHRGADEGGASRFFPTFHYEAKAPTHERPRVAADEQVGHPHSLSYNQTRCAGCDTPQIPGNCICPDGPEWVRATSDVVAHPTVKPLALMQWLVKLVTPPGGTVLEPFAGSGTTAEACVIEHFHCIAIEREASYLPLIVARLTKPIQVGLDFGESA